MNGKVIKFKYVEKVKYLHVYFCAPKIYEPKATFYKSLNIVEVKVVLMKFLC